MICVLVLLIVSATAPPSPVRTPQQAVGRLLHIALLPKFGSGQGVTRAIRGYDFRPRPRGPKTSIIPVAVLRLPGKPVACNYGLLWLIYGLILVYSGLLF